MVIKGRYNKLVGWFDERDWLILGTILMCCSFLIFELDAQSTTYLLIIFTLIFVVDVFKKLWAKFPDLNKPIVTCSGDALAIKAHNGKVLDIKYTLISSYKEYPSCVRIYWSDKIGGSSKSIDIDKYSMSIDELTEIKTKVLTRYKCLTN